MPDIKKIEINDIVQDPIEQKELSTFDLNGDKCLDVQEVDTNDDGYVDISVMSKLSNNGARNIESKLFAEKIIFKKWILNEFSELKSVLDELKEYPKIRAFLEKTHNAKVTEALPSALKVLAKFECDPQKIEETALQIMAKSNDYISILTDLPNFILAAKGAGYTPNAALEYVLEVAKSVPEGSIGDILDRISISASALEIDGYKIKDAYDLCLRLVSKTKENSGEFFACLPTVVDKLRTAGCDVKIEQLVKEFSELVSNDKDRAAAISAGFDILYGADFKDKESFDKLLSGLKFAIKYANAGVGVLVDIADKIGIDFSKCATQDGFVAELITKYNQYVDSPNMLAKREPDALFEDLGTLINSLHDSDGAYNRSDSIRTAICQQLSSKGAYLLMTKSNGRCYTSTFFKIFKAQKLDELNIKDWIKAQDPDCVKISDFIISLCKYGLIEIVSKDKEFFMEKSMELVEGIKSMPQDDIADRNKNRVTMSYLVKLFDKIVPLLEGGSKKGFAEFLIRLRDNPLLKNEAAFLIKKYTADFALETYCAELGEISKQLPEIKKSKMPSKEWLKDGAITAKLYFYPDEKWYAETVKQYKPEDGWSLDTEYMKAKGMSEEGVKEHYKVFFKKVGDVVLRVVLTNATEDMDDRISSINDPEFDIICHRGHSYHLEETFKKGIITAKDKLCFAGACGSFGGLFDAGIVQTYFGNYFIADCDSGEGLVNFAVLNAVMDAAAKGEESWDCLAKFEKHGIIRPDDPSFMMARYAQNLTF